MQASSAPTPSTLLTTGCNTTTSAPPGHPTHVSAATAASPSAASPQSFRSCGSSPASRTQILRTYGCRRGWGTDQARWWRTGVRVLDSVQRIFGMRTRCLWDTIQDLAGRFCRVAFGGRRQRGRRFGSGLDGNPG